MYKITHDNEERLLQKTSATLILPSIYGYCIGNHNIAAFNVMSCLISGLFWYNPYKGFRRNLDLIYQPLFAYYMLILGNTSSAYKPSMFIGNFLFMSGTYLYRRSCESYKMYNRFWYIYHGLFHISMSTALIFSHTAIKSVKK